MTEAYIYDAIRTPRGRGKPSGSLHATKPVSLVVTLLKALRRRNRAFGPELIDDIVLGCVSPVGEQGMNLARAAALAAGYDSAGPGFQLNRFCSSGLDAINLAAERIRSGWHDLILAGGAESMSRVPMGSDGGPWASDPETAWTANYIPQGVSADLIATIEDFSRADVDTYAYESQMRAAKALADGAFGRSVVPVTDRNDRVVLDQDEYPRPDTTMDSLAELRTAFATMSRSQGFETVALQKYHWLDRIDYVHTAGNSSGIVDGAALAIVGSERIGTELALTPRARVAATAVVSSEPTIMLTGPEPAARRALGKAGLTFDDIDLFEVNEAFAAVVLKFIRDTGVPREKVNVHGGAIALGHPLGATGAMLVATILDELERRDQRFGLVTMCVGAGMGVATVVERLR